MYLQKVLQFHTSGRGMVEITREVKAFVVDSKIEMGLCHVFVHHTSASLILSENADPSVGQDLETFLSKLAPDGDPNYKHRSEGKDDMAAHIRTVMTKCEICIPITDGTCALGSWQGIFLWEHRCASFNRKITVTLQGD